MRLVSVPLVLLALLAPAVAEATHPCKKGDPCSCCHGDECIELGCTDAGAGDSDSDVDADGDTDTGSGTGTGTGTETGTGTGADADVDADADSDADSDSDSDDDRGASGGCSCDTASGPATLGLISVGAILTARLRRARRGRAQAIGRR